MKMSREYLLAVLKAASPALANAKNPVQELSCLWFSGTTVAAYDDVIGIQVAFEAEFTGGVSGEKLLGLLENSAAREVTLEDTGDGNLAMKLGGAKVKLALRPFEDWFWHPELPRDATSWPITDEFLDGVRLALISVGASKVLDPGQRGVTVIQDGDRADLYTTDATCMSWASVHTGDSPVVASGGRFIMPTPFCEQLGDVAAVGQVLTVDEDAAYLTGLAKIGKAEGGTSFLLFCRLVDDDNPIDFKSVIGDNVPADGAFDLPGALGMALDRAMVVLDEGAPVQLDVEEGAMYLLANTGAVGEVDDGIKLHGADDHPAVTVRVDPKLLRRGLEGRESMRVTENVVVLRGPGDFVHVVSTK